MSVPGEQQQRQQNEDSELTEEEDLQRRIDAGIKDIIGNDDGKPTLEDFLNDPILMEKYADEEVQQIFTQIEDDPARIADYKDNEKVKGVLRRICEIFDPYVGQEENLQQGGLEGNLQNMADRQNMGGGNQNPFAQLYQGEEQNESQFADFSQLMQEGNPMASLAQMFGSQLLQGQGGNPMENFGQQFQGQGGNPMELLNQLLQGQGQNPMANLASFLGDQGDDQINVEQLAVLRQYLQNMT